MAELNPRQVVDRARPLLQGKKGVLSVGYGKKRVGGRFTDTSCVVVYVEKKLPISTLSAEDAIPFQVEGVPTDVVEIKTVPALIFHGFYVSRKRPCPGGYSIGHPLVTAGTLGLPVVKRRPELHPELAEGPGEGKDDQGCLLSNAHVIAPHWAGEVKAGDPVFQPGKYDGGDMADTIAFLHSWVPIDFGGPNRVDGALAQIGGRPGCSSTLVDWRIEALPTVYERAGEPQPDMDVVKVGRTTGLTRGKIVVVGAAVRVDYGGGRLALFTDQLEIVSSESKPFSRPGDSGSAILSQDGKVVLGLLFAGDDTVTYANPIGLVQQALGFEILPRPEPETIEKQLEGLAESLVTVWGYDAATQSWKLYDPAVPTELNTLKVLEKGNGYWLKVARDIAFTYHDFTYPLVKGWNLIGWQG